MNDEELLVIKVEPLPEKNFCHVCKAEIKKVKNMSQSRYMKMQYCSRKCFGEAHVEITVCPECKKPFKHAKSKDKVFCSKDCSKKSRATKNNCKECNSDLSKCENVLKFGKRSFCCKECMIKNIGSKLRFCVICHDPLECLDGNLKTYSTRKYHTKCLKNLTGTEQQMGDSSTTKQTQ